MQKSYQQSRQCWPHYSRLTDTKDKYPYLYNCTYNSTSIQLVKDTQGTWVSMEENAIHQAYSHRRQICLCVACLRAITKFCRDSPVIVYRDKLYIHSSHTTEKCDLMILLGDTWRQPWRCSSWSLCIWEWVRYWILSLTKQWGTITKKWTVVIICSVFKRN